MGEVQVFKVGYSLQNVDAKLRVTVRYFRFQRFDSEGSVVILSEIIFFSYDEKCFYCFPFEIIVLRIIHKVVGVFSWYF